MMLMKIAGWFKAPYKNLWVLMHRPLWYMWCLHGAGSAHSVPPHVW